MELELLAIAWAGQQCEFYLKGCPKFEIITDHKPLVGYFRNKRLDMDNERMLRL